jgi:hypothetical protein
MTLWQKLVSSVVLFIGKIHWPTEEELSYEDQQKVRELLVDNYFVILTYRRNHLSSFFTGLASFLLSGKWSKWTHALMNLEDSAVANMDFRIVPVNRQLNNTIGERMLIEATGSGSAVAPFELVFDCHAVALLKPKHMTLDKWTSVLDKAKENMGKPYDTLFNIADDNALSCVELVRSILQAQPNYEQDFANFEALIRKHKNLSPQMFYDCGDFEVVFEARV